MPDNKIKIQGNGNIIIQDVNGQNEICVSKNFGKTQKICKITI